MVSWWRTATEWWLIIKLSCKKLTSTSLLATSSSSGVLSCVVIIKFIIWRQERFLATKRPSFSASQSVSQHTKYCLVLSSPVKLQSYANVRWGMNIVLKLCLSTNAFCLKALFTSEKSISWWIRGNLQVIVELVKLSL